MTQSHFQSFFNFEACSIVIAVFEKWRNVACFVWRKITAVLKPSKFFCRKYHIDAKIAHVCVQLLTWTQIVNKESFSFLSNNENDTQDT